MTQQRSEATHLRAKLARSGRVWGWPQQAIFYSLTAGKIIKNVQLWPQLPCLPFSGEPGNRKKHGECISPISREMGLQFKQFFKICSPFK